MDDRRPGIQILLIPGVVAPPTPADLLKWEWYTSMGTSALALATSTRMGDNKSFEVGEAVVEEELKWRSLM